MQCILYKIYFWKVFHMYYNLICILYALLCGQNFILVKSGCYMGSPHPQHPVGRGQGMMEWRGSRQGLVGGENRWSGSTGAIL
jgi:hypothetical protein